MWWNLVYVWLNKTMHTKCVRATLAEWDWHAPGWKSYIMLISSFLIFMICITAPVLWLFYLRMPASYSRDLLFDSWPQVQLSYLVFHAFSQYSHKEYWKCESCLSFLDHYLYYLFCLCSRLGVIKWTWKNRRICLFVLTILFAGCSAFSHNFVFLYIMVSGDIPGRRKSCWVASWWQ